MPLFSHIPNRLGHPRPQMTAQAFKDWFERMDTNKDGRISKEELQEALKSMGLSFVGWKVWRAMAKADVNRNRVIDPVEMDELVAYAKNHWGIIIQQT